METVSFDEFKKLVIRIGEVVAAEKVADADKLLRLRVSFGDEERQIVSGIAAYVTPESLIGQRLPFVLNIPPRTIRGVESHGMILAAVSPDGEFSLLKLDTPLPPGSEVR
jgi:methionyl-tRNA synthetase